VLFAFSGFPFVAFSFSTLLPLVDTVFHSVGLLWHCWLGLLTCKTLSQITYTVLVETLNPAQSINIITDEQTADCSAIVMGQ